MKKASCKRVYETSFSKFPFLLLSSCGAQSIPHHARTSHCSTTSMHPTIPLATPLRQNISPHHSSHHYVNTSHHTIRHTTMSKHPTTPLATPLLLYIPPHHSPHHYVSTSHHTTDSTPHHTTLLTISRTYLVKACRTTYRASWTRLTWLLNGSSLGGWSIRCLQASHKITGTNVPGKAEAAPCG
jgi:hypothetical protein